jgi:uncharacterized DUF497 family protein
MLFYLSPNRKQQNSPKLGTSASQFYILNMYKNVYSKFMQFTWDEQKRQANLKKHGLDFVKAPLLFAGATFTISDNRFDYGEERFITIGLLDASVIVIAHTETNSHIRIISMRKGTNHENEIFFTNI